MRRGGPDDAEVEDVEAEHVVDEGEAEALEGHRHLLVRLLQLVRLELIPTFSDLCTSRPGISGRTWLALEAAPTSSVTKRARWRPIRKDTQYSSVSPSPFKAPFVHSLRLPHSLGLTLNSPMASFSRPLGSSLSSPQDQRRTRGPGVRRVQEKWARCCGPSAYSSVSPCTRPSPSRGQGGKGGHLLAVAERELGVVDDEGGREALLEVLQEDAHAALLHRHRHPHTHPTKA